MVDIVTAIIDGDLATVKTLLAQGIDPNTISKDYLRLVHYAAITNQPLVFAELVKYHADVNAHDAHNNQTLYFAARAGASQDFIKQIIQAGGTLNNQNKLGQTATHVAARLGNVDALKGLLKFGANPNIKDIVGKTPLMDAVKTIHPEAILILKEYGASSTIQDNYNATPLSEALKSTSELVKDTFELPILEKLKIPDYNPMLIAVIGGNVADVEAVIAAGSSPNATNSYGISALHYAALHGDSDIISALIDAGAYHNLTNYDGIQAIHFAAMTHQIEALDTLIKLGASVNAIDNKGNTPLHYAAEFTDEPAFIQKLLDAGASINAANNTGETPLHLAAADGNLGTVKFLVEHHANVAALDTQDETPLQEAVKTQHADVSAYLSEQKSVAVLDHKSAEDTIDIQDVLASANEVEGLEEHSIESHSARTEVALSHSVYVNSTEIPIVHVDAIL